MTRNKILWLEDEFKDFAAYLSALFRAGYLVDKVRSVSDAVKKLRTNEYLAAIFDIKVIPGKSDEWIEIDQIKRQEQPDFDTALGFELLQSLFNPTKARVKLNPPLTFNPKQVIVFSVVYDKVKEISSLGIPKDQIIYKANSNLDTLPRLIQKIEKECQYQK